MNQKPERRDVSFASFDELIGDAEQLAAGETRTVGQHSFAAILHHLKISFDASSGRISPPKPPLFMRVMRPLIRMMVLNDRPLSPGIQLPAQGESFFWPGGVGDVATGMESLKEAIENYQQQGATEVHPFFGKLTRQQSDSLNLRHAALHLSFVHPVGTDVG